MLETGAMEDTNRCHSRGEQLVADFPQKEKKEVPSEHEGLNQDSFVEEEAANQMYGEFFRMVRAKEKSRPLDEIMRIAAELTKAYFLNLHGQTKPKSRLTTNVVG